MRDTERDAEREPERPHTKGCGVRVLCPCAGGYGSPWTLHLWQHLCSKTKTLGVRRRAQDRARKRKMVLAL